MQSEWLECTLGDAITLKRGYDLPAKKRRPGAVPIVSSSGISDFHADSMVKGPGVVTGRYGTIGQVFYVSQNFWPLNTTLYVQDFKGNDRRFISYLLRTVDYHQFSDKAAVPGVNRNHLHTARIALPPPSEQVHIAGVLQALDDRIDLLRQTNATLEAIAQALFKSWFVDFDPVRAKAEGREPEGMDAATAALFPSEFEDSALGPIPKGWRAVSVADMCSHVSNGGTPSRAKPEFWSGGKVPWFKTGELVDAHLLRPTERITSDAVAKTSVKVLPRHAVLMAIYAAPTVGRLGILTEEAAFNQACTGMVAKPAIGTWFLFQTLFHARDWFNSRANGAAQQNISKGIVESYQCVQPSLELLRAFHELASELYASAERGARQAHVLAELRDALLPRLISGKLRIGNAADLVDEALT